MASVEVAQLDHNTLQSLACTYTALLLHDTGKELSAANFDKVLAAAGTKVDKTYTGQVVAALKHANVGAMLSGASSAPVAAPAAAQTAAPAAAGKKEEPKKEEKKEEEEDAGGAMDLFGGDEW